MKKLATSGVYTFTKLEHADEVDKFELGISDSKGEYNFEFFQGLGMVDYTQAFKTWLRAFPRPIFILATKNGSIVAWVYITDWKEPSKEGDSIYVLRAIETLYRFRSRKLGLRLLMLGLNQTSGYMITKPLNNKAERFFRGAGFKAEKDFKRCPVNLTSHHGYLILPPFKKQQIMNNAPHYFEDDYIG